MAVALVLACGPVAAAQLYRSVDDQGRVEWRDTPPPAGAKNVEQRSLSPNTIQTSDLPYSVQQAVKNFPVTVWTMPDCGEPCNLGRAHLSKRGIPFTERNARKEPEALKKVGGGVEVPVLTVGSRMLKGYLETDWDSALDVAGYPRTPPPGSKPQAQATTKAATAADTPKPPPAKPAAKQP